MTEIAEGRTEEQAKDSRDDVIVLIEPRSLTRQCLSAWLEQVQPDMTVRALRTPDAAIDGQGDNPALIIWCIGSSPVTSDRVTSGLAQLRARFPSAPRAVLVDRENPDDIRDAIHLGVKGYVPTSLDRDEALEVLKFVRAGGTYVPARTLVDDARPAEEGDQAPAPCVRERAISAASVKTFRSLTPREADVVDRLRQGKPNKVIAHELDISESTVKVFVHRILNKLGAINRTEVAYLAQQQAIQTNGQGEPAA